MADADAGADETAEAFLRLLTRPHAELDQGIFEIIVEGAPDKVDVTWKRVELDVREEPMEWSRAGTLQFHGQRHAAKK